MKPECPGCGEPSNPDNFSGLCDVCLAEFCRDMEEEAAREELTTALYEYPAALIRMGRIGAAERGTT